MMEKDAQSVLLAASVGAVVVGINQAVAPSLADVSASPPDDDIIAKNAKTAGWLSAGVVAGISLLMKDPTVFVIGSAITIGYVWWYNSANLSAPGRGASIPPATIVEAPKEIDVAPVVTPQTYGGTF